MDCGSAACPIPFLLVCIMGVPMTSQTIPNVGCYWRYHPLNNPISSRLLRPHVDQWLGHSDNDKLQPCVSDRSHSPCVSPSRSQFNSILFGTEEIERDTKSLDFGQQHTRIKDNMITQLSLGTAIGQFILGGDSCA